METAERPHQWKNLPPPSDSLTGELVRWFERHGRDYPWRRTEDPFQVLCAELMLQRTRADQVAPVFQDFCQRFESPAEVTDAGQETVDAIFDKLGLRWRAEYFWELQGVLIDDHEGQVPQDLDTLLDLPGVGRYAATATRVFAFGKRETVIDANVLRVFGRWYGIDFPDHARRSPRVARWANEHAPDSAPEARGFNWALIDLGAQVCTPQKPRCAACPVERGCWYAPRRSRE